MQTEMWFVFLSFSNIVFLNIYALSDEHSLMLLLITRWMTVNVLVWLYIA